jgi:hypothetical protein
MFNALGALLARVLKPGARAFCVFGQMSEDFERLYEHRAHVKAGAGNHLVAGQTICWVKSVAIDGVQRGHYTPLNSEHLLNYGFEFIMQFIRAGEKPGPLNRLAIGVPFSDKGNLTRDGRGKNGDLHCAGDAWFITYPTTGATTKKDHRHAFPPEVARRLLVLANVPPGGTVLDPFVGGGTTAFEAQKLGLNMVAVDSDPAVIKSLHERWRGAGGTASEPVTLKRKRRGGGEMVVTSETGVTTMTVPFLPDEPELLQRRCACPCGCSRLADLPTPLPGGVQFMHAPRCVSCSDAQQRGLAPHTGPAVVHEGIAYLPRKRSRTLAALLANDGLDDPVSDGGTPMHPDDTLTESPYTRANPPAIPGRTCGTPGCSAPQLHATDSGDLCKNGHGEFTGRPSRKKTKKKLAKKKAKR